MASKEELYLWACTCLRELIKGDSYGNLEVAVEKGFVTGVKKTLKQKPPVDFYNKKP